MRMAINRRKKLTMEVILNPVSDKGCALPE